VSTLRTWLLEQDPGGDRLRRTLQMLAALALSGGAAVAAERAATAPAADVMPLVAAALALFVALFANGTTRGEIARQAVIMAGAGTGALVFLAILQPATWGYGRLPTEAMLIPVAFATLYLRRFGPLGFGSGFLLFIGALYGVILEPTRAAFAWMIIGGVIGLAGALIARLGPGAHPPDSSRRARGRLLREQAVELIDACREAIHHGDAAALQAAARKRRDLKDAWIVVRTAIDNELAPDDPDITHLRRSILRLYVLTQAVAAIAEAVEYRAADLATLPPRQRQPLAAALGSLRRLIAAGPEPGPELIASVAKAADRLSSAPSAEAITDPVLRFTLDRISCATERVAETAAPDAPLPDTALPKPGDPKPQPFGTGPGPAVRIGLQGAAATAILVLLDAVAGLDHAYWAIVAAVFIVANSFADTWQRAVARAAGTLVGVLLAIALGAATGHDPRVLAPAAVLALLAAGVTIKTRYGFASGAIGFTVILAIEIFLQAPLGLLFARIWETALGAAVAMAVAWLVYPIRLTDQLGVAVRALVEKAEATAAEAFDALSDPVSAVSPGGGPLLAAWIGERERFRNIAVEIFAIRRGPLAEALTLARLEALCEQTALFADCVRLLSWDLPPSFHEPVRLISARTGAAFAAVRQRLERHQGPATPPPRSDDLLPLFLDAFRDFQADRSQARLLAETVYHARRVVDILIEAAEAIDARSGGFPQATR